jgi:hypothetical protein
VGPDRPGNNDHDFYVVAGGTAVLVHNCDPVSQFNVPSSPGVYTIHLSSGEKYVGMSTTSIASRVDAAATSSSHALAAAGYTCSDICNVTWMDLPSGVTSVTARRIEQTTMEGWKAQGVTLINRRDLEFYVNGLGGPDNWKWHMGTWGSGLFASDSAQDFLDEMRESGTDARLGRIRTILERTASDPSVIMREYVPEEIVVAAAMIGATLPTDVQANWIRDGALQEAIADIEPQVSMAPAAASALQAAMDFNDGWLLSSLRDESDRQSLQQELAGMKRILESHL